MRILGFLRIPTDAGTGKVLTSDADGVASWQAPAVTEIESLILDGGAPDTDHTLGDSLIIDAGGVE